MLWKLILLFTVVPALELYVLLQLGSLFGPTPTFLLILVTGIVGASLAKREGLGVLRQLQEELSTGLPGGPRIMEAVLVVVGGLLLVTPGVLTDLTGFALIAPPTRRFLAPRVLKRLMANIDVRGTVDMSGAPRSGQPERAEPTGPWASPFDD